MRLGKAIATGYAVEAAEEQAAVEAGTPEEVPVTVAVEAEPVEAESPGSEQVVLGTAG